jgi:hypothetical protein
VRSKHAEVLAAGVAICHCSKNDEINDTAASGSVGWGQMVHFTTILASWLYVFEMWDN